MKIRLSALKKAEYIKSLALKGDTKGLSSDKIRLTLLGDSLTFSISTGIYQATVLAASVSAGDIQNKDSDFDFGVDRVKFFSVIDSLCDEFATFSLTVLDNTGSQTLCIKDSKLGVKLAISRSEELDEMVNIGDVAMTKYSGAVLKNIGKLPAFASKKISGIYSGVFLILHPDSVAMYASDEGVELYYIKHHSASDGGNRSVILPKETISAISNISVISEQDEIGLGLLASTGGLAMTWQKANGSRGTLMSRTIVNPVIDVEKVLAGCPLSCIGFNISELKDTISLYQTVTDFNKVSLTLSSAGISIAMESFAKSIPASPDIPAVGMDAPITFSLSADRLKALLANLDGTTAKVYADDSCHFIVLSANDETAVLCKVRGF